MSGNTKGTRTTPSGVNGDDHLRSSTMGIAYERSGITLDSAVCINSYCIHGRRDSVTVQLFNDAGAMLLPPVQHLIPRAHRLELMKLL